MHAYNYASKERWDPQPYSFFSPIMGLFHLFVWDAMGVSMSLHASHPQAHGSIIIVKLVHVATHLATPPPLLPRAHAQG